VLQRFEFKPLGEAFCEPTDTILIDSDCLFFAFISFLVRFPVSGFGITACFNFFFFCALQIEVWPLV